ncbi:hypothetical protein FRC06_004866, partial [Ceratobasidium sp. 370]
MSFIADYPLTSLSSALFAFFVARKIHQSLSSPLRRLAGPVYSYEKSDVIRTMLDRVVGKSLPYVTGETHKRQRYQLSPFFTLSTLPLTRQRHDRTQATRDMFSVIEACAQTVADRLVAEINNGTTVVNVPEWTGRATLDVIGRFAFDYDFECGENEVAKTIQRSWKVQVDLAMQRAGFIGLLVLRACPWIVDLPIKAIQQEGAVKTAVRGLARKVIERGPSQTKQKNLLSTLVGLAAKGELDASSDELLDH